MSYIGKTPTPAPLTSSDITDGIISTDKLAANAVVTSKITDATISNADVNATLVTGQTAETSIADGDTILIHDASASALRKMTKANFVSGVGETNIPMFRVSGGATTVANSTNVKLAVSTEVFDPQSKFDLGGNNRFTPAKAGKYLLNARIDASSDNNTDFYVVMFYKNGSSIGGCGGINRDHNTVVASQILESDADDYFEVYARQSTGGSISISLAEFSGFYIG